MSRWAAVLAGGSGTRFWPLSTPQTPKQLLPIGGDVPLLRQSVDRLAGVVDPERTLVVTGAHLLDATRTVLPDIPEHNLLAEPRAASTAPALTWATHVAATRDPGATVLSLHADWHVADNAGFAHTAGQALEVAEGEDALVTVGIVPSRPDVGYGYIEPGEPLSGVARRVSRFTEKPDADRARTLVAEGALWNSGLFAWTARRFFAETETCAPEIHPYLHHLANGNIADFFDSVEPIAVDFSHFERSDRVAVVPASFGWDDVGTWVALRRILPPDDAGNVTVGDVVRRDATGCIAWADDGAIVLDGVADLVVVRAHGVTLVTTPERASHLKQLLDVLPPALLQPSTSSNPR